ncbi:Co2+/Mg2+ efflux protein ApaG [Vibrio sp. ZSDE26]|uniref:Protein ApaG n=1 Tax=Vibrio amylolyticus TaxID=2847292 RepID=A0A9X1XLE9_9VIBR|nr:Co2+/Mg2+ efflux protein ApaG [Vibrio amylolyticus]MCK6263020.1 Co2+/Mg2+ efflux protein ApaG [Vibrio amylolyticus]
MIEPTPEIKIHVQTKYVEEQSTPDKQHYVFAYLITIKNLSDQTVQLLSRRWLITDADGKQLTIEGEGVVGQQPHIESTEEYSYTSATAIETPIGVMQGQYIFHDANGDEFTTEITPFRLAIPNILN